MIISIGGSEREVKFNFNVISFCSRLHKMPFTELVLMISYDPIGLLRDMIYSSLKTYPEELPDDFNLLMVGDWLSDVSQEDLNQMQLDLLTAFGLNEKDTKEVKKKKAKQSTL